MKESRSGLGHIVMKTAILNFVQIRSQNMSAIREQMIYCVFWVFSASVPKYRKYAIFLVSRSEQSAREHFGVHMARESSGSIDAGLEP